MHVECPHCQTNYEITHDVEGVLFVCHRCGFEFPATGQLYPENNQPEPAPVRKTAHIWPWFVAVLLLVICSGFWFQKDAWLDNRWFRSTLINIGFDMPLRAKDWRIASESVRSVWITRNDDSRVLLIRGKIKNLLASDMVLPNIEIVFFSKTEPDKQIARYSLEIDLPPSEKRVRQVPYSRLAKDNMPVRALGSRAFTILVEPVPAAIGDFTLTPSLRTSG